MNIRTKKILLTLGIIVILGIALRYCTPWGKNVVLVPLHGGMNSKSAGTPLNHARAQGPDPISAFANAFKTPIELYGNVVDQHGDPVQGAMVTLSPVDAPFGDESRSGTILASDDRGKFSIKNLRGFSMGVSVKKEGYLHLSPLGGPASSAMVSYAHGAEQGRRYSNPATPLVLTLHKIGNLEPMVYVEERNCRIPVDGTVRRIALDSDVGTGTHQIEFQFKTGWVNIPADNEHFGDRFDWTFEARIPGGGFIWSDNDYNFEAPESGYRESIRLEYKANMPREKWQRVVYGSFFVKFADGSHGRIRFNINSRKREGDSPLMLASWLNLKPGSRNLATPNMTASAASDERNKKEWGW